MIGMPVLVKLIRWLSSAGLDWAGARSRASCGPSSRWSRARPLDGWTPSAARAVLREVNASTAVVRSSVLTPSFGGGADQILDFDLGGRVSVCHQPLGNQDADSEVNESIRISEDRLADGQGPALGSGDSGLAGRRSRLCTAVPSPLAL